MVKGTERRFPVILEPGSDELLVHFKKKGGKIEWFKINYRALVRGKWTEVVRYDMAHGHLHVHRFWLPAGKQIEALDEPKRRNPPYNEQLTKARDDLRENWEKYRRSIEQKEVNGDDKEDIETDD